MAGGRAVSGPAAAADPQAPSPYARADLYDLLFRDFAIDLEFYRAAARASGGAVLDVGCGTGRLLLPFLAEGLDVDGLDSSPEMLERLRMNAAAKGLSPRVTLGDMRAFRMSRRYACVMIPFNAFAHSLSAEEQLDTLRGCHEHLLPGGRLVFDVFSATPAMTAEPVTPPVLEIEVAHPRTGLPVRLYDSRRLDVATQIQHSQMEIHELDAAGAVARVTRSVALVRWVYPSEMELLLRLAGFARWEIAGGFDGAPLASHQGQIVVSAWRD
jgi:SAM-dependent methyltransferase